MTYRFTNSNKNENKSAEIKEETATKIEMRKEKLREYENKANGSS